MHDAIHAPARCTDWFIHSHYLDKYVMFVSWFCFFQTALQTMSCFTKTLVFADSFYGGHITIVANILYTLLYASFLLIYLEMQPAELPSCTYICGIVLYTAGYVAFGLLGIFEFMGWRDNRSIPYIVGSWCFIVGSAAIAYALKPAKTGAGVRCPQYSGLTGSCFFLVGSFVFAADSMGFGVFGDWDAVVGYVIFVVGRVLFVEASQTAWCTVCFRKTHELDGADDSTDAGTSDSESSDYEKKDGCDLDA
jgi:hypothetical protein